MAAFQFAVDRIIMNYGEDVDLSENEKKTHAYAVSKRLNTKAMEKSPFFAFDLPN